MDPITIGYIGIIGASVAYHWWENRNRPKPKPESELKIPIVAEGAAVPLVYGRIRVDRPVLAWTSGEFETNDHNDPGDGAVSPTGFDYHLDMFFVVGVPFFNGTNRIHRIWAGGDRLPEFRDLGGIWPDTSGTVWTEGATLTPSSLSNLTGAGNYERNSRWCVVWNDEDMLAASIDRPWTGGEVEWLNGNPLQELLDPGTLAPKTRSGEKMIEHGATAAEIPDYRGYMSVGFSGIEASDYRLNWPQWITGFDANVPAYSFEVSSYPATGLSGSTKVNSDGSNSEANPADVIADVLCAKFAKLGLPIPTLDTASFVAAATTLAAEGNGYSRCIEEHATADQVLGELAVQINGLLDENPGTGKIRLKLIRDEDAEGTLAALTPANCEVLSYEVRGVASPVTQVRVVFNDRQRSYQPNNAVAQNMAVALASGEMNEVVVQMPGVCTMDLAAKIAKREIEIRTRPMSQCKVRCSRAFIGTLAGDVVTLTWPEYGLSQRLFRVMHVNRGTLQQGWITLTLIEEAAFLHRGEVDRGDVFSFPPFFPER